MTWLWNLVSFWADLDQLLASWAYKSSTWVWPLNALHPLISLASTIVLGLFGAFFDFSFWVNNLVYQVTQFLTWSQILAGFQSFISQLGTLWTWFQNRISDILSIINTWWLGAQSTIQGWIDTATQGLNNLIVAWDNFWLFTWPTFTGELASLRTAWDSFWTTTLPSLISSSSLGQWWQSRLLDIDNIINGAFTLREDLWKGWLELREDVGDFFADPWQWLYDRLDDFIERFW